MQQVKTEFQSRSAYTPFFANTPFNNIIIRKITLGDTALDILGETELISFVIHPPGENISG